MQFEHLLVVPFSFNVQFVYPHQNSSLAHPESIFRSLSIYEGVVYLLRGKNKTDVYVV